MKKIAISLFIILFSVLTSCQDQLDIKNPNAPQFSNLESETGIYNFAMGGVYATTTKYSGPGLQWNFVYSLHELMGDIIGAEFANSGSNQIGCPDLVVLDNGTQVVSPQAPPKQKDFIRQRNLNQNEGNNPLFYEWAIMYSINNSCNMALSLLDDVLFSGDETATLTKKEVIKAWCYFWKGFAYSKIGSIYYAGIINDEVLKTNSLYVTKEAILLEAEKNFALSESILNGLTADATYSETLGKLIPNICQVGKGGILTPDMWRRNINTLRARNILVNTAIASMTSTQWSQILSLTLNGIQSSDKIFTIRSNATADLMSASGNVPARTRINGAFKVSERFIQDFKTGDLRKTNNFIQTAPWIGNANRGNAFNTRWDLRNGGGGLAGVAVMQNRNVGAYELYLAGFFEENELMKAEANIFLSNIDEGLSIIDNVRSLQGAGLAPVSGTGLSQALAIEELKSERRIALAFRALSFYDARRYDVINTGRTGTVVVDNTGFVNTNATIHYNFLDYWDVPDNELVFNPPAPGSVPVKNPNGL